MNFIKPLKKAMYGKFEKNARIKIGELLDCSAYERPLLYVEDIDRLVEIQKNIMVTGVKKIGADVGMLIFFILLMLQ